MNPNSPKSILLAAVGGLLIAATLIPLPLVVGVNPWFVIVPLALVVLVIRGTDSRRRSSMRVDGRAH